MPESFPTVVWFRRDLRLRDHAALLWASRRGVPVVPVFILDEAEGGRWAPGGASRWWLHGSLESLAASLAAAGLRLVLRRGDSATVLRALVAESRAGAVCWNDSYEPTLRRRDDAIAAVFRAQGVTVWTGGGGLLCEPEKVQTQGGGPFQVFTPFWRHCRNHEWAKPEGVEAPPRHQPAPARWPHSEALASWGLRPRLPWADGFPETGAPGEPSAEQRLAEFLREDLDEYERRRDRPASDGTSRLSAALHWGELSVRQIASAIEDCSRESGVQPRSRGAQVFLDELGWREFAHHLLWHFPETPDRPLRRSYEGFPWRRDEKVQLVWRQGQTGYPIVDAGMRQLWRTGWMHNRVRMIVSSVFVKHLLQPWQDGAAWFWDTLVDADLANNTLGWQWSAGCGADAAPYFRVFNPVLQGGKFDADGAYVRRWVPELARLPAEYIHRPWEADALVLAEAGIRLGRDYPRPLVEPKEGRARALAALQAWREAGRTRRDN